MDNLGVFRGCGRYIYIKVLFVPSNISLCKTLRVSDSTYGRQWTNSTIDSNRSLKIFAKFFINIFIQSTYILNFTFFSNEHLMLRTIEDFKTGGIYQNLIIQFCCAHLGGDWIKKLLNSVLFAHRLYVSAKFGGCSSYGFHKIDFSRSADQAYIYFIGSQMSPSTCYIHSA